MSMTEQLQTDKEIAFMVGWEHEDELPDYITDELYGVLYPMSKLDSGLRVFPYIVIDEKKHFLGDLPD